MTRAAMLALFLLAACGRVDDPPEAVAPPTPDESEDYVQRLLHGDFDDVDVIDAALFAKQVHAWLQRYKDPYPQARIRVLFDAVLRIQDLEPLRLLLGPRPDWDVYDQRLHNRDIVASAVVRLLMRRAEVRGDDLYEAADLLMYASWHFGFDALYGESSPRAGASVGLWLGETSDHPVIAAAVARYAPRLIEAWRKRGGPNNSSSFFGHQLRWLGAKGADLLSAEWERMVADEREDLLERFAKVEFTLPPTTLHRVVDALVDPAVDVRRAAHKVLQSRRAPLGDLDPSAPERDLRPALGPLHEWVKKTGS